MGFDVRGYTPTPRSYYSVAAASVSCASLADAKVTGRQINERDFDERERQILDETCDATQRAADLGEQIDRDGGAVIETSTGRKIEHPGVRPLLHFKAMAMRGLAQLKPAGPGSPGRPAGWVYGDRRFGDGD